MKSSVVDRYYTRTYKKLTPQIVSRSLFSHQDENQKQYYMDRKEVSLDQFYFEHSNHLILFGVASTHDLIQKFRAGVLDASTLEISFDRKGKSSKLENTQKISGKKKNNAIFLTPESIICEIRCHLSPEYQSSHPDEDKEVVYKPRCLLDAPKLLELNTKLLENPRLLLEKPESEGFVAIL